MKAKKPSGAPACGEGGGEEEASALAQLGGAAGLWAAGARGVLCCAISPTAARGTKGFPVLALLLH